MKLKNFTQKDRHGNMISYDFYESDDNMGVPEMQSIPQHPGSPKGTDTVPAWLTPGEFVMNAEATRMFEPQIEQMNNAGRAVQAQQGGTIPEYAANGGPVYFAEGSGGFFDKLLNMFSDDDTPKVPDATQSVVPPPDSSRADRVAALIEASKTDGPTRPDPTMSNKMYMDFLKNKEGFRNEAYLDSAGVPTIGYGFTEGVQMGDTIDEKTANERLLKEMAKTDQDYNKLVTADLNPNQQAAVKSLLYNIGGPQFANSKARAALNAGDFESFKKEAAEFRMANGKVIPGLENRRRDELELFFKPYKANRPETSDSKTAMIPGEEQDAFQRDVKAAQKADPYTSTADLSDPFAPEPPTPSPDAEMLAAQKATREQGMYDPDGNMEAIQAGIDQAQILEDQRRRQQVIPPRIEAVPPEGYGDGDFGQDNISSNAGSVPEDTRNAFRKFGDAGGLMGALSRGTDSLNEIKEKFQKENIEQNETFRSLLSDYGDGDFGQGDAMANAGAVPDLKEPPPPNVSLNQGEYGVNDTIIREDANGNPITYKWDSSKDAYVDDEGLEYNRGIGERVSSLFKSETVENAEPETGDTQIGTLNGNPVYMGQDGKPYVMEDLEVLGTSAGVQKMNIQPWQTDDIKMLPKENRPVAGPKTPSPKDKDGLVPLPMDTSIPDELSGTPMDSSASVPKPAAAPPKPETESSSSTDLPDELQAGQEMNSNKAIEDAGKTAPPEQINEAESFLSGIFGDLFDSDELKRMAIMYVGGRVLGGSHSGSLNFATKQYVKRVDSKVSAHKEYVKELTKGGTYTPKSIALYNKTKNISDLEKKGATYAPTGGAPITKMIPQFNKEGQVTSYKKATLVPVKNSITGGTHYQSASGTVMHPAQIASLNDYREELDETKEAYKQRRSRILGDMEGYFSEIRDKPGNFKGEGKDKEYIVGVGPKEAALAYYDWAKKQGVDPDSTAGRKVMTQAYETMVAEAAGKDIKYTPNDFTRFLEDQQLRETTGAPELFIINEDAVMNKKATPKYVQADKMSLLYQNLDTVISGIPNSSTNRGAIIGIAIQKWNKLDSTEDGRTLRKKYNDSAEKSAGESGFYKYMMDTAQALHAELNKPKQ
jgi:lysozyme